MVMMRFCLCASLCALCLGVTALGQDAGAVASPIQKRLEAAQMRIRSDPKSPQGYNNLAFAYCRWARDTGDAQFFDKAEAALQHSLQLSPDNMEAKKLQVTVLLGKHQPEEALKLASSLQIHNHDDITIWALLVDANIALNKFDEAERDAQWILDLRSGSSLGFTKAARIRELTGDLEGATQFYEEAARRTAPSDMDERAWLLTQNARCQLKLGNPQRAESLAQEALKLFPDSQLAKATLASAPDKQQAAR